MSDACLPYMVLQYALIISSLLFICHLRICITYFSLPKIKPSGNAYISRWSTGATTVLHLDIGITIYFLPMKCNWFYTYMWTTKIICIANSSLALAYDFWLCANKSKCFTCVCRWQNFDYYNGIRISPIPCLLAFINRLGYLSSILQNIICNQCTNHESRIERYNGMLFAINVRTMIIWKCGRVAE